MWHQVAPAERFRPKSGRPTLRSSGPAFRTLPEGRNRLGPKHVRPKQIRDRQDQFLHQATRREDQLGWNFELRGPKSGRTLERHSPRTCGLPPQSPPPRQFLQRCVRYHVAVPLAAPLPGRCGEGLWERCCGLGLETAAQRPMQQGGRCAQGPGPPCRGGLLASRAVKQTKQ